VADFTVNFGGVYDINGLDAGSLGFPTNIPGVNFPGVNAVQAYGLGIPSELIQGLGNPHAEFANNTFGFFVQDSWRIKPNLTVNYGVRYDLELMPPPQALSPQAQAAYKVIGITNSVPRDSNNVAPRIGIAWDPGRDGKTVIRASYGMFYDHPLLGLQFLAQATDGSGTPQVLLGPGSPCNTNAANISPLNMNATNTFQGILGTADCLPPGAAAAFGYLSNQQRFNPAPNASSLFINQGFQAAGFPLGFLPFGFPNSANFVYPYSEQANFTIERDLGHNLALSVAYNFNGGHHLNRPINANTVHSNFLISNWERALAANAITPTTNPLAVTACGVGPVGPYVPAALVNFFRPTGFNPSLVPVTPPACVGLAASVIDAEFPGLVNGFPAGAPLGVPLSDMSANYSNGSSVYHGLTMTLRKRFSKKYEFLASYTWSHAIDDSTDLQAPLSPQDSYNPSAERSNSTFDQRHRFVFSGIYQTGRLSGSGFWSRFFSDWTVAPIIEVASGRPFDILAGGSTNFEFEPNSARPNAVHAGTATDACGNLVVPSKYSPTGFFQLPCFIDSDAAAALATNNLALLDGTGPSIAAMSGNIGRNSATKPYTLFNDLRIARRIHFTERVGLDAMVDIFNLANKFNVADVNPLYTEAGQPTAACDPRQFQFALKLSW
jgi:hypothetical protein